MRTIHLVSDEIWLRPARVALEISRMSAGEVTIVSPAALSASPYQRIGAHVEHVAIHGLLASLRAPSRIARLIETDSTPITIIAHGLASAVAGARARRLCQSPEDIDLQIWLHILPAELSRSDAAWLDEASVVWVDSQEAAKRLSELGYGRHEAIRTGLPVPRQVTAPTPLPCRSAEGAPVTFAFHGAITPVNGVPELINAFISLANPRLRMIICGEGRGRDVMPLLRRLRQARLDEYVEWTGTTEWPVESLMRADIGVYPYRTGLRTASLAAAECMASGRPAMVDPSLLWAGLTDSPLLVPIESGISAKSLTRAMRRAAESIV